MRDFVCPMIFLIVAIVGDIIGGIMVWNTMRNTEITMGVFALIFSLVGIGATGGSVWCFLALWNPRLEVALNPFDVELGKIMNVRWRFIGPTRNVERLVIRLEGKEEATYQQGTRTHTDKNIFYKFQILDRVQNIEADELQLQIPLDLMHSLEAKYNKIIWILHFEAQIPRWPDVTNQYKINLIPPA